MGNGDIAAEVKRLLEGTEKISQRAAVQLMLTMQLQTYQTLNDLTTKIANIETRVEVVDRTSIVLWVRRNPQLALFLFVTVLLISLAIDPRDVILSALKIPH